MGRFVGATGLLYLWEKIKNLLATGLSAKADKATTLAGYGITDAINTSSTAQTKAGNLTAAKFITSGGTSSQFLKADGSVDSNTYAPIASPTFTGTPAAPTAVSGTKTTQIATTAFVDNATTQSFNKIISMGENLVINGNGYMMDNTNFSSSVFNLLINNSSFGSFEYSGKKVVSSDYRIPLNPSLKYKLSADVKALNTGGSFYGYIDFYDIDGNRIEATNHMWHSDQCSYLTQDLNPGDTVVHINDLSKWNNTYAGHSLSKGITFWNYTNSKGYTYPPYTYTRNFFRNMYNEDTDVDVENGIIHLKSAWTGTVIPANTKISRTDSGNTFKYLWLKTPTTDSWLTCYGFCSGIDYSGSNASGKFPPGTAFGKVGFLVNYGTEEKTWITNISLTTCAQIDDIPAAVTESTVSGWGFTKNAGTITGITMNGASKGTSGVVDLGTVLTSFTETDPTVPSWAKASTKPSYTASEVGALPDTTVIPAAQVNSDWNATSGVAKILNKPTIPTVPTTLSAFTDDLGSSPTHTHSQYLTSAPVTSVNGQTGAVSLTIPDVSGKADKVVVVNTATLPASLEPNKVYQMGTLTGSVTIPAFASVASGDTEVKIWCFTFSTSSTAPTITWPAGITAWNGGDAPEINADKSYEVSVMDGIGAIIEA